MAGKQDAAKNDQPVVWLLLGEKAGDNNQILALAESLQCGWVEKHLRYIDLELIPNRLLRVTLAGLTRESDPLEAPWPDLVISAGRRNEPCARWIKKQSPKTLLVHMGRPWARPKHFDLIITTPQYDLGSAQNVVHNDLPLHRIDKSTLQQHAETWRKTFEGLPKPWIALFVGGDSATTQFTAKSLCHLARSANDVAVASGGSLLISTSARTPKGTIEILSNEITCPSYIFDYHAKSTENPYHAYLALSDEFIVTAESISMLTETCATGKQVWVFDPNRPDHQGEDISSISYVIEKERSNRKLGTWLRNNLGPRRLRRDIGRIHEHLIREGRIQWLGLDRPTTKEWDPGEDLERATRAVQSLLSDQGLALPPKK